MTIDPQREDRGNRIITAIGRLRPGVTLQQVQADMAAIAQRMESEYPESNRDWGYIRIPTFYSWMFSEQLRRALAVLLGAVGFVLLIACAIVANLLLSRAVARRREIAIRRALGAGRRRLIRHSLLTESAVLAAAGGGAGILIAVWGTSLLRTALANAMPRAEEIAVTPRCSPSPLRSRRPAFCCSGSDRRGRHRARLPERPCNRALAPRPDGRACSSARF